jgi:hypothetical protein
MSEKEEKKRMLSERLEEESIAPLEFLDGVMEQVEAMVKELRRISRGIQVLIEVVGRLTEVVMGLGEKEVEKKDKGPETETVQRMDREVEMEIVEQESESEEEEEKKDDDGKEDGDQEMEEVEKE